jgi:hypothetical protein
MSDLSGETNTTETAANANPTFAWVVPRMLRSAISAFTRVFDALRLAAWVRC